MRYENQNPQYIHLLEKIEEQEKKITQLTGLCRTLNQQLDEVRTKSFYRELQIENFKNKRWYKKMFYKFNI